MRHWLYAMLPELPGQVQYEPDQAHRYYNVESRDQVVVGDPPGQDPPSDHNPNIWNKEGKDAENSQTV